MGQSISLSLFSWVGYRGNQLPEAIASVGLMMLPTLGISVFMICVTAQLTVQLTST